MAARWSAAYVGRKGFNTMAEEWNSEAAGTP